MIATSSPSTDFPLAGFTGAGQGAGLFARLDFAGAAGIYEPAVRSCWPNCCPKGWPGASAPCPARSRNLSPRPASSPDTISREACILATQCALKTYCRAPGQGAIRADTPQRRRARRQLSLGLEPEPLCLLETNARNGGLFRPPARRTSGRCAAGGVFGRHLRHLPSGGGI